MKQKTDLSDIVVDLIFAASFILSGVYLLVNRLVVGGTYARNNQVTGFGGWFLILFGVIFLIIAYYSLSPFSKIRQFFERKSKTKQDKDN